MSAPYDTSKAIPLAWFAMPWPGVVRLILAGLILCIAGLASSATADSLGREAIALILLTAVMVDAAAFGLLAGLLAAAGAFCLFNFFFIEPRHSLFAARPQDFVLLSVMLISASVIGLLAGRLREQVEAARLRADMLEILSATTLDLSEASEETAVLGHMARHVARLCGGPALILKAEGEGAVIVARSATTVMPGAMDLQAAAQALARHTTELAASRDDPNASQLTFQPFGDWHGNGFVLGFQPVVGLRRDGAEREQALADILRQGEAALHRIALARAAEAEHTAAERQALRSTLLASLSHDLRTPIATILGSLSTLRELRQSLSPDAEQDLLDAAEQEAERLRTYVERLLQITRLMNGGKIGLHPIAPSDCVRSAVLRARRAFPDRIITTEIGDLPVIEGDASLLEQAVFGLTENALKYTSGRITVSAQSDGAEVLCTVTDEGAGLSPQIRQWLAGPELLRPSEDGGLGLPIAKGIARALGGRLVAEENRSAITLHLPGTATG